jgi:hypothetical protein
LHSIYFRRRFAVHEYEMSYMNEEKLKSAVLAKCENVAPNCGETYTTPKGTALRTNDRQIGDSCNQWRLDEYRESSWVAIAIDDNAPSDSWVWQLAADILGIKQAEQPRQSDALLWECWKESANEKEWSARVRARESDRFNEWLATLPTDALKADRELVADFIIDGHLSFCLGNAGMPVDLMRKITSAINRLAGMEVENG